MHARLRRGLGALRLAFVVVSHVRSSKSRLRHCKPKSHQLPKLVAELPPIGLSWSRKTSSAREIDETHLSRIPPALQSDEFITTARPQKSFGPQRRQGPTRFL